MDQSFQISLAPSRLTQSILPGWNFAGARFGLFNIDLGQSGDPALEREMLDKVGSYGRQIGRIGDALAVLIKHRDGSALSKDDQDALDILIGQVAQADRLKASPPPPAAA